MAHCCNLAMCLEKADSVIGYFKEKSLKCKLQLLSFIRPSDPAPLHVS